MKKILVLLIIAVVAIACSNGNNNDKGAKAVPVKMNNDEGKKLFKMYCVACHGKDGKLALNGAKDFTKSTMTLEERIIIISEGRNMMTPFKGMLKEKEIKAIAAYTMKLTDGVVD